VEVTWSKGVTTIPDWTFDAASGIRSFEIPEGVTSIGHNAFFGTNNLVITIPQSVISINENAFAHSSNLTIRGSSGSYAQT